MVWPRGAPGISAALTQLSVQSRPTTTKAYNEAVETGMTAFPHQGRPPLAVLSLLTDAPTCRPLATSATTTALPLICSRVLLDQMAPRTVEGGGGTNLFNE